MEREDTTSKQRRNRLGAEKSPYLLQHADNPVDWYPWQEEAFDRARRENNPVFLSIGYSTCHWCHVMAHESFEDAEVARLMNDTFVSVKVDREERPDIDRVYMNVCQMMTGSGGWPLTIIMTPDKEPFFAATYIPKDTRFGRIGLVELIPRIQQVWAQRQSEAVSSAKQLTEAIRKGLTPEACQPLAEPILHQAYEQLQARFDAQNGGFSTAPKFPTPHNILFLLRYWKRTGNEHALSMVEGTLKAMRRGGIYDHVGFGFHRYATDPQWLVPHFEKMLYDQALLAMAYTETYQATGGEVYARTAREIFEYVLRDMTAPQGGFYSAEDADSEGEEGKFYLWTEEDIRGALPEREAALAIQLFIVSSEGNFNDEVSGQNTGRNILHLSKATGDLASDLRILPATLQENIEKIRRQLFSHREKRVHPHKDDKILTDWNGLMIASLARGGRVFNEPCYTTTAERAATFILKNVRSHERRLLHRYRDGEAAITAHMDDYSFLIYGLLELYEATFAVSHLETARELTDYMIEHFWDKEDGGFYFSADDAESLLVRPKDIYDGAIPSGNSVAMLNLLRLGRITANADYEALAARISRPFYASVSQLPSAHTQLMVAIDFAAGPYYEVVIAGDPQAADTKGMLAALQGQFLPNKIVILRPGAMESPPIDEITGFTSQHTIIDGKATAYVCRNYNCQLPTTDTDTMLSLLSGNGS